MSALEEGLLEALGGIAAHCPGSSATIFLPTEMRGSMQQVLPGGGNVVLVLLLTERAIFFLSFWGMQKIVCDL